MRGGRGGGIQIALVDTWLITTCCVDVSLLLRVVHMEIQDHCPVEFVLYCPSTALELKFTSFPGLLKCICIYVPTRMVILVSLSPLPPRPILWYAFILCVYTWMHVTIVMLLLRTICRGSPWYMLCLRGAVYVQPLLESSSNFKSHSFVL